MTIPKGKNPYIRTSSSQKTGDLIEEHIRDKFIKCDDLLDRMNNALTAVSTLQKNTLPVIKKNGIVENLWSHKAYKKHSINDLVELVKYYSKEIESKISDEKQTDPEKVAALKSTILALEAKMDDVRVILDAQSIGKRLLGLVRTQESPTEQITESLNKLKSALHSFEKKAVEKKPELFAEIYKNTDYCEHIHTFTLSLTENLNRLIAANENDLDKVTEQTVDTLYKQYLNECNYSSDQADLGLKYIKHIIETQYKDSSLGAKVIGHLDKMLLPGAQYQSLT